MTDTLQAKSATAANDRALPGFQDQEEGTSAAYAEGAEPSTGTGARRG